MIQGERATMEPKNEGSEDDLPYIPLKWDAFSSFHPLVHMGEVSHLTTWFFMDSVIPRPRRTQQTFVQFWVDL